MTDPRRKVHYREGADGQALSRTIHDHLIMATALGMRATGMTGVSFVTVGIGIWLRELMELDTAAAGELFHALGDLAADIQSASAEARRRAAVVRLCAAADLALAEGGRA